MMDTYKRGSVPLSLFCVICDREKREKVLAVMEGSKSFFNLAMHGKGTASSKILGYLGLGETEKAVFLCIMPTPVARLLGQKMNEKFEFNKPGHGITFRTAIHSGCYHKPIHIIQEEDGGTSMQQQSATSNDMIIVVLNRGYTEEVMEAARGQGATGGTVLHARGCGLAGAEKFFGVTIQPEKEMILIVASADISCAVMDGIAQKTGPETPSGAVSFSMPVSGVRGIGLDVPADAF